MDFEEKKTVLILGGYGNAGLTIARLLLWECEAEIIIAGRNLGRAQRTADELNREFDTDRASSKQVDAANADSLKAAFAGVDIVVVASSTMDYVHKVFRLRNKNDENELDNSRDERQHNQMGLRAR